MSLTHVTSRTLSTVLGRPRVPDIPERLQVEVGTHKSGWLKIDSFDQLLSHEHEILERIAKTVNGGNLFMANPFLLLADIGVQLSDRVREAILKLEPNLSAVSDTAYDAIKTRKEKQNVRIHVHGLFPRRAQ